MNFKNNLNKLMTEYKINQVDLAKKLGLSKSTINLYLKGLREPTLSSLEKMCDIFKCTYNDLLN